MGYPAKKERNAMIKKLHKKGVGYKNLGKMFNVHWSTIRQIIKGYGKVGTYTQGKD